MNEQIKLLLILIIIIIINLYFEKINNNLYYNTKELYNNDI
jgi:hypothetical protein